MSVKFARGIYKIKNKDKYIGNHLPVFRSGWESVFFSFCDNHPGVIKWASEAIRIPYRDPITGKEKGYYPDIFMIYLDANGEKHAEIIEIKPENQSKFGKSPKNNAMALLNYCKWQAALQYCEMNGISFRLITENSLFKKGT